MWAIPFTAVGGAAPLSCNTVISVDTVLDSDVGPCPEVGLQTGADGIVIDLNGHQVFGSAGHAAGNIGLFIVNSGVTVKNGTVSRFKNGVSVVGSQTTISGMNVIDNIAAGPSGLAGGSGIFVIGDDNVIRDSRIIHNGPRSGIQISNGDRNVIDRSVIAGNDIAREGVGSHGEVFGQQDVGVLITSRLADPAEDNVVTNNIITRNGSDGVLLSGSRRTTLRGNDVSHNGVGGRGLLPGLLGGDHFGGGFYVLLSNDNVIEHNRVVLNTSDGIFVSGRQGAGVGNVIRANTAVYNGLGDPSAFDLHDARGHCDDNVWSGNRYLTKHPACIQ